MRDMIGLSAACALLAALASVAPASTGAASCTRTRWESRLDLDFEPFQGGITRDAVDRAERRTQGGYRVLLLNNTLHTIPLGWEADAWSDRKTNTHPIFHLLLQALCLHRMPDVEFVINIFDRRAFIDFNDPAPILSWTKEMSWEYDLLYPYWQLYDMNATVDGLHADAHPWAERQPRAFFRGATTGGEFKKHNWRKLSRPRLVRACQHHAHLCDAGLTNYVQIHAGVEDEMRAELGSWKKTPMDECSKYKYNIIVDGNAAPSQRLASMLQSGSTLLKQESPSVEFFYDDLQPYVHYVPLSYQLSDVVRKVDWCRRHDDAARRIADNAAQYARSALTVDNIACYWHRLLTRYSALMKFEPASNATYAEHRLRFKDFDGWRMGHNLECAHYAQ